MCAVGIAGLPTCRLPPIFKVLRRALLSQFFWRRLYRLLLLIDVFVVAVHIILNLVLPRPQEVQAGTVPFARRFGLAAELKARIAVARRRRRKAAFGNRACALARLPTARGFQVGESANLLQVGGGSRQRWQFNGAAPTATIAIVATTTAIAVAYVFGQDLAVLVVLVARVLVAEQARQPEVGSQVAALGHVANLETLARVDGCVPLPVRVDGGADLGLLLGDLGVFGDLGVGEARAVLVEIAPLLQVRRRRREENRARGCGGLFRRLLVPVLSCGGAAAADAYPDRYGGADNEGKRDDAHHDPPPPPPRAVPIPLDGEAVKVRIEDDVGVLALVVLLPITDNPAASAVLVVVVVVAFDVFEVGIEVSWHQRIAVACR